MEEHDEQFVSNDKPNTFMGMEIGQFRVIGQRGQLLIPRQYGCTLFTMLLTIIPALLQLFLINPQFS